MSKMGNSGLSPRQRRRERRERREAANNRGDGNPPSTGELPPGGMQIFIDPECHEITITTNPQSINHRASSSNRTGEASGGSAINRNDAADTGEEGAESDSDTRSESMMLVESVEGSSEDGEDGDGEGDGEDHLLRLPTLRLLAQLLGRRNFRQTEPDKPPPVAVPMDPQCELYSQVLCESGRANQLQAGSHNICTKLSAHQFLSDAPSRAMKVSTTLKMLPEHPCLADAFESRAFCGTYSRDGSIFISGVQDNCLYLYDTTGRRFKRYKSVHARDVGWSILDTSISHDQQWFLYSTWSPCVHVCNVWAGDEEKHYSLDLVPQEESRFCAFAARFSSDGSEIAASANDGFLYIYNRDRCERTLRIDAHQDEANAVSFADDSSHIIASGGDDGICKVWDRRTLSEAHPSPVGLFAGHKDGITFIDSKGDGRYLITNSKDQSIKLWDLRMFSSSRGEKATLDRVRMQMWDYRWESVPRRARQDAMSKLAGDTSIMTFAGHTVKNTLLRCRFSPAFTTGQSYIYTACARGRVIIYDVLTGEIVKTLKSKNCFGCIRDVSWHPTEPGELVATSWDGILQMWTYRPRTDYITDYRPRRRALFDW